MFYKDTINNKEIVLIALVIFDNLGKDKIFALKNKTKFKLIDDISKIDTKDYIRCLDLHDKKLFKTLKAYNIQNDNDVLEFINKEIKPIIRLAFQRHKYLLTDYDLKTEVKYTKDRFFFLPVRIVNKNIIVFDAYFKGQLAVEDLPSLVLDDKVFYNYRNECILRPTEILVMQFNFYKITEYYIKDEVLYRQEIIKTPYTTDTINNYYFKNGAYRERYN